VTVEDVNAIAGAAQRRPEIVVRGPRRRSMLSGGIVLGASRPQRTGPAACAETGTTRDEVAKIRGIGRRLRVADNAEWTLPAAYYAASWFVFLLDPGLFDYRFRCERGGDG
jgi:hypothetical protein